MGATSVYPQAPDEKLMRRQSNEKNEIEEIIETLDNMLAHDDGDDV